MTIKRGKLAINDLPCIDYYNDKGWLACIYEMHTGLWSIRLNRVELLSCYHTEQEAIEALSFWIDIPTNYIPD